VERFLVTGGARLAGTVQVAGAKNSVLKLMAASLLAEGTTVIANCPDILDVPLMADVLRGLGATVRHEGDTVSIATPADLSFRADFPAVGRLRASVCVLGPLMGRCRQARVALPGGDAIGSRPLDMHQSGLRAMGATMNIEHGSVVGHASTLHGASIGLDFPSVGATENILMAAVLADGTTVIDNAAREPEIVDLARMLQGMGAKVDGAGSSTIEVQGVTALSPTTHATVPDRIVAGTFAMAAVMTRGDIEIHNARPEHLEIVLDRLVGCGAAVSELDDGFHVEMNGRASAVDVVTLPFPGFPTDFLPMIIALNSVAEGAAMVTENVFEGRFRFIQELVRLGADIRTDGHHAVIRGRERLSGAPVEATDIRAGAGLVLAGLVADGVTTVSELHHIDRGYADFVQQLQALGADVVREPDPAVAFDQ